MSSVFNTIFIALENGEMTNYSIPNDGNPSSLIEKIVALIILLFLLRAFGVIGD